MRRTDCLVVGALALAIANLVGWATPTQSDFEPVKVQWIAMNRPLEKELWADTSKFLASSHSADPRYVIYDENRNSLLAKASLNCKAKIWAISIHYNNFHLNDDDEYAIPVQLPDRVLDKILDDGQVDCINRKLPTGYQVFKLQRPIAAADIGWGVDDVKIVGDVP